MTEQLYQAAAIGWVVGLFTGAYAIIFISKMRRR